MAIVLIITTLARIIWGVLGAATILMALHHTRVARIMTLNVSALLRRAQRYVHLHLEVLKLPILIVVIVTQARLLRVSNRRPHARRVKLRLVRFDQL